MASFSFKKGVRRATHWTFGLALIPSVWATWRQTGMMVADLGAEGVRSWWRYLAGVGIYLSVERLLKRPMWLYVFGHELTHAVSGLLAGARIHSFKASAHKGEVRLSKSNAFIALSPYIIPIYAVGIIVLYATTKVWWNHPLLVQTFQFLLGMALAFHISLTISAIHGRQTDLKVVGFFLSGVLILLGNALILGLLGVSLFSKTPTLATYAAGIGKETIFVWKTGLGFTVSEVKRLNHNLKTQRN
jgi:hypothetical protein